MLSMMTDGSIPSRIQLSILTLFYANELHYIEMFGVFLSDITFRQPLKSGMILQIHTCGTQLGKEIICQHHGPATERYTEQDSKSNIRLQPT